MGWRWGAGGRRVGGAGPGRGVIRMDDFLNGGY